MTMSLLCITLLRDLYERVRQRERTCHTTRTQCVASYITADEYVTRRPGLQLHVPTSWLRTSTNNCSLLLRGRNAAVICFNLTESGIFINHSLLARKQIENRIPNRRQSVWDIRLLGKPQNKLHPCLKCNNQHIAELVWKQNKSWPLHTKTIISARTSPSPSLLSVYPVKVILEHRAVFEANHPFVFYSQSSVIPSRPPRTHLQHLGKLGFSK